MNWFSKAFSWIIGGSNAAEKTIETGAKMLDNAFYTDQEKATNHNKILDWFLEYQKATAPQNISRRIIALMIVGLWCAMVATGLLLYKIDKDYCDFIFTQLKDVVMNPFLTIIAFYFLTQVVRSAKS